MWASSLDIWGVVVLHLVGMMLSFGATGLQLWSGPDLALELPKAHLALFYKEIWAERLIEFDLEYVL